MYQVEGYAFETEEQETIARHETEVIAYIRANTRLDDPDVVLALYNKLVQKEIFVTPVGIDFLRRLQEYLHTIPYIAKEELLPIPVYRQETANTAKPKEQKPKRAAHAKKEQPKETERDYRKLFHVSMFFAILFAAAVAGMFAITWLSTDNVNILNYENELINKYEAWEKQLDEREEALQQREEALTEQEEQQTWTE